MAARFDLAARLDGARNGLLASGFDALLVSPGADLRYLTGYDALPLERLTCLVLPASGEPCLVVPALEELAAQASPVSGLGVRIVPWQEAEDAVALVSGLLGTATATMATGTTVATGATGATTVALDDHMWAEKVLGRTEREVGRDIADAIISEGHARVDFVIVASGPNGASPHAEASDRVIEVGDTVVVDIGGTTESGYCSDETRTYCLGHPPGDFLDYYAVLLRAQLAACEHARPGVTAESVDAAARDIITAAGHGEAFLHRTGHGIGLETHEEPYIVAGNNTLLEPGMAFSIEPGIYLPGRHSARIEDIVVVTGDGCERLNQRPRDLAVLPA